MGETLKVPFPLDLWIGITLSKDGKVIDKYREKGHSWTRNAWNFLFASISYCGGRGDTSFGAGYLASKSTAGYVNSLSGYSISRHSIVPQTSGLIASNTSTDLGIVCGTGDAAFDIDDFKLQSLIASGIATGQLSYQTMAAPVTSYASKKWKAVLKRVFFNASGSSIIVKEVGLHVAASFLQAASYTYLLARDVLDSPAEVENGVSITVDYDIEMDFSSID